MTAFTRTLIQCLLVLGLITLVLAGTADACPTCKNGLGPHDPAQEKLAQGYFWSIMFMMSMPFLILFTLGTYFYIQVRRAKRRGLLRPYIPPRSLQPRAT